MIEDWKNKRSAPKRIKKTLKRLAEHKGKHLDRMADAVHEEVFQKIDCLDCANCCTTLPPIVTEVDARRISKHLKMSVADFNRTYLLTDEDGDTVMRTVPCVFLGEGNACTIYDHRPKACRRYPHTDGGEFSSLIGLHKENVMHCPAAWAIVEEMGKRLP